MAMSKEEQEADTLPAPPYKSCGCGQVFTVVEWSEDLEHVGIYVDEVEYLDMRNCPACKSTLAVPSSAG